MNEYEKVQTIKNVVSDLNSLLNDINENNADENWWLDAKLAVEYIIEEQPHL